MKHALASLVFILVSGLAFAEQKADFEDYELHYIILNTTELAPQIADKYDITRSGKRAFINLSILKKTDDGYAQAVTADIHVNQRSLVGQQSEIPLREIKEGGAVYYIGDFQIFDRETLWFDIKFTVDQESEQNFSFSQQVWQN